VFADAHAAVDGLVHPRRVYEPDPERHARYGEIRERWESIYEAVSPTYSSSPPVEASPTEV
jgi:sugar (pentulose or hexulose) kinase